MSVRDITPERAIGLPPSLELDMFMFANVLQGPEDMLRTENLGQMPSLSRKYGASQMVLLMAVHELGQLSVDVSPTYFGVAKEKGFIVRKTECIVWKIAAATATGYGRSFEEALCKLLIAAKYEKN